MKSGFLVHDKNKSFRFGGRQGRSHRMVIDTIALILVIIGALNWGSIGLFSFDIVAWIFGGQAAIVSRIIYTLVGLAGLWSISLLFRPRETELPENRNEH